MYVEQVGKRQTRLIIAGGGVAAAMRCYLECGHVNAKRIAHALKAFHGIHHSARHLLAASTLRDLEVWHSLLHESRETGGEFARGAKCPARGAAIHRLADGEGTR